MLIILFLAPLFQKIRTVKQFLTGLDRVWGIQGVETLIFQHNRKVKVLSLSALRINRLYPQEIFMVLIHG
jgi:hypothetical protein